MAKGKAGRTRIEIDLKQVEQLAGIGMSNREIAAYLSIHEETFYTWLKTRDGFSEAVRQGRAKGKAIHMQRVLDGAKKDWRASMEFLRRHGDLWKDTPLIEAQNLTINNPVVEQIGQDAMDRMASTWLRSRGQAT